jgi:hypothetical protein
MFFDDHPEFLETSDTATSKGRLNLRHLGMIEANADILRGRSVVDIASHDGRWSYAALEAGARSVIGVEGRMRMVKRARATFEQKGVPPDTYEFLRGDAHRRVFDKRVQGEVVMCLGFLYHTARYVELMAGIATTGAEYIIIDTRVITGVEGPLVQLQTEGTGRSAMAIRDRYALGKRVISATPSEEALVFLLDAIGYDVDHRTDWIALLKQHRGTQDVAQYRNGTRVTFRARRRQQPTA